MYCRPQMWHLLAHRRLGLRRSSRRLLQHTGRTRRRRNSFASRVVKRRNNLPLAVSSVPEQRTFKTHFTHILTRNICSFFRPFPLIKNMHTNRPNSYFSATYFIALVMAIYFFAFISFSEALTSRKLMLPSSLFRLKAAVFLLIQQA